LELRLRLARAETTQPFPDLGPRFERVLIDREREADAFYARFRTPGTTDEEAAVMRRGFAGLVWSQQFYHYDVERWLDGDAAQPTPPTARRRGRNAAWRHLDSNDVLVKPDKWEYPWYAAWDLGFHCVTLAQLNPAAAKHQLLLLCREWFMHPNGQLPAYEWGFGDVNPPVHAWAALRVYTIDGSRDRNFLVRIFHKLLLNFTWWVNRKETLADNVFTGGFLGLDNIGPFDRSAILPPGVVLEQADSTAWMAMFCLDLLEMALELAKQDPAYQDVAVKFFEHFANIATAMNGGGLWDEADGFYYDRLRLPDGRVVTLRTRSMVGLVPLCAALAVPHALWARLPEFRTRMEWFIAHRWREKAAQHGVIQEIGEGTDLVMLVDIPRLRRLLGTMLNEEEFLSPYGLRSLSRYHREPPVRPRRAGERTRVRARLRARRVDGRAVRRQLQLAGADLVPPQLPRDRRAPPPARRPRRRVHGRTPDRLRTARPSRHRGRRSRAASSAPLPSRHHGSAADLGIELALPEGSRLAGRAAVP
jgi:hypothetical protein